MDYETIFCIFVLALGSISLLAEGERDKISLFLLLLLLVVSFPFTRGDYASGSIILFFFTSLVFLFIIFHLEKNLFQGEVLNFREATKSTFIILLISFAYFFYTLSSRLEGLNSDDLLAVHMEESVVVGHELVEVVMITLLFLLLANTFLKGRDED